MRGWFLFLKGKQFACIHLIVSMNMQPFVHSICKCEVWTKTRHHCPCSVCAWWFMPFALRGKRLFQGIVILGRETILHGKRWNCYYLDSREITNLTHPHACPCCISNQGLGLFPLHSCHLGPTSGCGSHRFVTLWLSFSRKIGNQEIRQRLSEAYYKAQA